MSLTLTKNNRAEKHGVSWPLLLNDQGEGAAGAFSLLELCLALPWPLLKKFVGLVLVFLEGFKFGWIV